MCSDPGRKHKKRKYTGRHKTSDDQLTKMSKKHKFQYSLLSLIKLNSCSLKSEYPDRSLSYGPTVL
jgi:hypothetical protein